VLREELGLPPGVEPIAYLCLGHPIAFRAKPMLEELGWRPRRDLSSAVHTERWTPANTGDRPTALADAAVSVERIAPCDERAREEARSHQARLTKPIGSLGRLEEVAEWYAAARGAFPVAAPSQTALALFLADHGVVVEGVSAYGSQVTAAMACNVMAGGAAVNVLARRRGVRLLAVDVGIAGDMSAAPIAPRVALLRAPVRAGTRNIRAEPAMDEAEVQAALRVGARIADDLCAQGAQLAAVGEIGIGNTTSAAALVSAFTGAPPEQTCGRGTGVDEAIRARKVRVVSDALRLHAPRRSAPMETLAALGGLEIAAMVGFLLRAATRRLPVVLDGFVTNASALVAKAIDPDVVPYLLASHQSPEPGARVALSHLGLRPLLALDMRLGEGTGALLALDVVSSAVALLAEMSTFATAGVVREDA
jgi:nicotinate-nucleotide--dimethylbenzimidazole phosphoribosyltransferase